MLFVDADDSCSFSRDRSQADGGACFADIVIALVLIWLIYFKGKVAAPDWVGALPAADAPFNSLSALCLTFGISTSAAEIGLYINDSC